MTTGFEFLTQDDERLLLEKSTCVTYRPGEQILECLLRGVSVPTFQC